MNDFELSYLHHARARKLMAEAEQERRAKAVRASPGHRPASRLTNALRHKGNSSPQRTLGLRPKK